MADRYSYQAGECWAVIKTASINQSLQSYNRKVIMYHLHGFDHYSIEEIFKAMNFDVRAFDKLIDEVIRHWREDVAEEWRSKPFCGTVTNLQYFESIKERREFMMLDYFREFRVIEEEFLDAYHRLDLGHTYSRYIEPEKRMPKDSQPN